MRGEHNRQTGRQAGPQLYADVTAKIVAELEAGRVPWVQPWDAAKAGLGLPRNAATGNAYSGINILILWSAVIERGFAVQNWFTFRQALSLGGHVRKGEKGVTLVYADRFTPKAERERAAADGDEARSVTSSSASPFSMSRNATAFRTTCSRRPLRCRNARPCPPPRR